MQIIEQRDEFLIDIDKVVQEARIALSEGQAGVAALLGSPQQIIAIARNTIQTTGDLTDHAEMVFAP